jgi:hypothetical protein
MKILFTLLMVTLLTLNVFSQAPQKTSYQAVIRDAGNALVTSKSIGMRVSILQGSSTGTEIYKEIYNPNPQTNANGLVTLEVGGGIPMTGTFSGIDWSSGPYYIKAETDPSGGTSYTITGTSQLLSVPYSLYSKTAASYSETDPVFGTWNKSSGVTITASQVSDFQTSVTNNLDMLANTAKVTNATHTGDATGSAALIVVGINGTSLAGLPTGILKNTTLTGVPSIAVAGTDYLPPNGSAALLTNFPTLNQNTTGTASNVTGVVAIGNGGTGASNAANARNNLGLGSLATMNSVGSAQITDGSITGSDMASATITSSNIASGTITSANLASGSVGTTQIIDGTVTTSDVNTISASKISGITNLKVPRSNGSALIDGSITDNGTNIGIGGTPVNVKFNTSVSNMDIAIDGYNTSSGTTTIGVAGYATNSSSLNKAFTGDAISKTGTKAYGIEAIAQGGGTNYAVYGIATGATTNYGVFGNAYSGSTNWSGYFVGNTYIGGNASIGGNTSVSGSFSANGDIQAPNLLTGIGTTLILDFTGNIRKSASDERLKDNIHPLSDILDKVLRLKGVEFTWKSDSTHAIDIGFVAQDVQKIFPELVMRYKDDGVLAVRYPNMVAILAEAIKEQQQQIESSKHENQQLRSELDELKALVNTLAANQTSKGNN